MKRLTSILLLIVFGVSSFTFKTHYCYHKDGTRFHGDCTEHIHEVEKGNGQQLAVVHAQKYICQNVQLEKQFYQQDYSFKDFSAYLFELPLVETPRVIFLADKHRLLVFPCLSGPPNVTRFLRGPPLI